VDTALLAARLLLAAVFASAAVSKLVDPRATATALAEFRVPRPLVRVGTRALPLVELAIAIALIPMATATWAAVVAAVLLAAFSSGVAGVLTRGERVDCNCFGAIGLGPVSRWTLLRDFVLLGLAAFVAIAGPGDTGATPLAWIGPFAVAAIAGVLFWSRPPERAASRAPDFDLPALDGERVTLAELLAEGRGLMIVFGEPSCAECERSLAAVGRLQRDHRGDPPVIVVSRGDLDANRAKASEHGLVTVLLEDEFKLARSLGITGMPGAATLDADGRIAQAPALGARAVDELLGASRRRDSNP
jgi:peroxiredoxin